MERMYKGDALEQQNPHGISRRNLLKGATGVLVGLALARYLDMPSSDFKNTLGRLVTSEDAEEEVVISRTEEGLYSKFRNDDFQVVISGGSNKGIDDVLFRLNDQYNPNLNLRNEGEDKLLNLRDLTNYLNQILPHKNLEVGEVKQFRLKRKPLGALHSDEGQKYYFPVYDLSKNPR